MVPVLLVDDGELDEVAARLRDIGIEFQHLRGKDVVEPVPLPRDLLITTVRRALALVTTGIPPQPDRPPFQLAVAIGKDNVGRSSLRRAGFDFLVRIPMQPDALALLLGQFVYRGGEKREGERVPLGLEVSYRAGLLRRRGVLLEISNGGCRLLCRSAPKPGSHITLSIPLPSSGGSIALRGSVLRATRATRPGADGESLVAVRFEAVDSEAGEGLSKLLAEHSVGPSLARPPQERAPAQEPAIPEAAAVPEASSAAELPAPEAEAAPAQAASDEGVASAAQESAVAGPETPEESALEPPQEAGAGCEASCGGDGEAESQEEGRGADLRGTPRKAYPKRIITLEQNATRVVLGRDLSLGGMRIGPQPGMAPGLRLSLALHGEALGRPLVLTATVVRHDGDQGVALQFDPLDPRASERLAKLVADLPAIESLREDEDGSPGAVLTQILPSPSSGDDLPGF